VLLFSTAGCSGDSLDLDAQPQNCGASDYTAQSPQNHATEDAHVAAQAEFATKLDEAAADPSTAAAAFAEVESIYQTAADLQAKVQARGDAHFPDDLTAQGAGSRIDTAITGAIALGKAATTATDIALARHVIDKSLTRFFYLSVHAELVQGSRPKYDAAYGYLGTGRSNAPESLRGMALLAGMRDTNNQSDHEARLFREIIDGACALQAALERDRVAQIAWESDVAYASHVLEIDRLMTEVLALSVGHEFLTPIAPIDPDEAKIKLFQGGYFFFALEDKMRALGGQAQSDALAIAAMINNAVNAVESDDPGWQTTFDSDFIRDRVAAAFGVTVNG
jgi:hypothetical protein